MGITPQNTVAFNRMNCCQLYKETWWTTVITDSVVDDGIEILNLDSFCRNVDGIYGTFRCSVTESSPLWRDQTVVYTTRQKCALTERLEAFSCIGIRNRPGVTLLINATGQKQEVAGLMKH